MPVPDFVITLRERIGHDLLWLPAVTAVVLRGDEVLLVRRSDNGQWSPVTGIVDPGEHPVRTAVREVAEETTVGCEVEALVSVGVTEPVTHLNGDLAQYLDHTFRCRYVEGEARVGDDESLEVRWWPLDALPELAPALLTSIQDAVDHHGSIRLG
jgi:ADP-ribose pyrophosphatase YjhB (NUDIX family)